MISVDAALSRIFALVSPLDTEEVPLAEAAGRVLAAPVIATRDQPPFTTSMMDGYAVSGGVGPGDRLRVVGEAAAGHGSDLTIVPGEALRIFTGAPLPEGAERVVIQEDVSREGDTITVSDGADRGPYIRPAGADFAAGDRIEAPRRIDAPILTLAAAMNAPRLTCARRPVVALIATGDELVMPGETPRPDQIVASNAFGLKAMVEAAGGIARLLPIAPDAEGPLAAVLDMARDADLIVTIGGASVGDHDLVRKVAGDGGLTLDFYRVAMRPGKPLMAGRLTGAPMIALPGNPVSSIVCGHVFMLPALRVMQGLPAEPAPRRSAPLAAAVPANGPREHYMRARLGPKGLTALPRQDSGLMSVLAGADALLVRPSNDPARPAGEVAAYLPLSPSC